MSAPPRSCRRCLKTGQPCPHSNVGYGHQEWPQHQTGFQDQRYHEPRHASSDPGYSRDMVMPAYEQPASFDEARDDQLQQHGNTIQPMTYASGSDFPASEAYYGRYSNENAEGLPSASATSNAIHDNWTQHQSAGQVQYSQQQNSVPYDDRSLCGQNGSYFESDQLDINNNNADDYANFAQAEGNSITKKGRRTLSYRKDHISAATNAIAEYDTRFGGRVLTRNASASDRSTRRC